MDDVLKLGLPVSHPPVRFERAGSSLTVYVVGEFDLLAAPNIEAFLTQALRRGDDLVVDLSAVSFCDSSGLRTLFSTHRRVTTAGGRFALRNPSRPVERVLQICDPSGLMTIQDARGLSTID